MRNVNSQLCAVHLQIDGTIHRHAVDHTVGGGQVGLSFRPAGITSSGRHG